MDPPIVCPPCAPVQVDEPLLGPPAPDVWDALQPGQEAIGDMPIVGRAQGTAAKTGMPGMPRPLPAPKMPTQARRDLHNLTHSEYVVW